MREALSGENKMMKMKLAETLKALMKERKIKSLRQLSMMCDIPVSSLHHIANGRNPTDWEAMARLSQCLEVPLFYLVFGKHDPISEKFKDEVLREVFSGDFHIEMKLKRKIEKTN